MSTSITPTTFATDTAADTAKVAAANVDKENQKATNDAAGSTTMSKAPAAVFTPISVDQYKVYLNMTTKELSAECLKRGLSKGGTKDKKLKRLGIPTDKWLAWRKMKAPQLKQELKKLNLGVSGNKEELLHRLGVPYGYGESAYETKMRELNQDIRALEKKRKGAQKAPKAKKSKLPEEDPTNEEYREKCCNVPSFPGWRDSTKPGGYVYLKDGCMMEIFPCLNCRQVPRMPNVQSYHIYSDSDSEDDVPVFPYMPVMMGMGAMGTLGLFPFLDDDDDY